jgi:hypothetical protein
MAADNNQGHLRFVAWFQGSYYVLSGVWPLVHIRSFELVTGPKVDDWLVQTVGLLVLVSGLVILLAAVRRRFELEIIVLAVGTALSLAFVDVFFVTLGRISAIYLADAVLEVAIVAGWAIGLMYGRPK